MRGTAGPLLASCLLTALAFSAGADPAGEADDGASETCLMCHGGESVGHGALGDSAHGSSGVGCVACHGPSREHLKRGPDGGRPEPAVVFDGRRGADERDAVCLDCHRQAAGVHWETGVHRSEAVACADCHRVHAPEDPALAPGGGTDTCLGCHRELRAQLAYPSSHPIRQGQMDCGSCHDPHGSATPGELTRNTVNETCHECHAETRGPFLWEHGPVREDCTICHRPHGSVHDDLLVARTPWLCQRCHQTQFHPSTAFSGTGVPPRGASQSVLLKDCMNCHDQVHGSNHPSGLRQTR